MLSSRPTTRKNIQRRGVAAVELAVCLPFVLLLVLGAVEVSSGLHQQHRIRAVAHECAKMAAKPDSTCEDVLAKANELVAMDNVTEIQIEMTALARTTNQSTVESPSVTYFMIDETGGGTPGLDEVPRGTVMEMKVTVTRPPIAGFGFTRNFLHRDIVAVCVFIKEAE